MPLLIVNYHNEQIPLPLFIRLLLCCGCNTSKKSASPDLEPPWRNSPFPNLMNFSWSVAFVDWYLVFDDLLTQINHVVPRCGFKSTSLCANCYAKETEAKQLSIRSIPSTFCPPHELKVHHLPGMSCSRRLHQFWEF